MQDKENQQILTLEKLEPANIWHFCSEIVADSVDWLMNDEQIISAAAYTIFLFNAG